MGSNAMALFRSVKRLGMTAYRRMFSRRGIVGLTSSEVFSLYMIELMDAPTIKDFAAYIGISQPNATYKIKRPGGEGICGKAALGHRPAGIPYLHHQKVQKAPPG